MSFKKFHVVCVSRNGNETVKMATVVLSIENKSHINGRDLNERNQLGSFELKTKLCSITNIDRNGTFKRIFF